MANRNPLPTRVVDTSIVDTSIVDTSVVDTSGARLNPQQRFRFESDILLILACLFVFFSHQNAWFSTLDRALYDIVISNKSGIQDERIVIVGIDDASLDRFGPWPWPRDLQASLLHSVARLQPKLIAPDIIYAGATDKDAVLVAAAQNIELLALPVMVERLSSDQQHIEVLPFPDLAAAADLLGHIHVELDPDAISRGTYLYQGVGKPHWPHLMLAIANAVDIPQYSACPQQTPNRLFMVKCEYVGIPFAGPPGTYPTLSAQMLLDNGTQGTNPTLLRQALQDKIVLIGLTASGVGDWVTSPVSGDTGPMSGVEFNANLLSALIHRQTITYLPAWLALVIALTLVCICSLLLPRLKPKEMLFTAITLAVLPVLSAVVMLAMFSLYLAVANGVIAVLSLYPIWSWRRHEIAWHFIQSELQRIDLETEQWAATDASAGQLSDRAEMVAHINVMLQTDLVLDAHGNVSPPESVPQVFSPAQKSLLDHALERLSASAVAVAGPPGEILAAQIRNLELRAKEVREGRALGLEGLGRMSAGVVIISALGEIRFLNSASVRLLSIDVTAHLAALDILGVLEPPLGQNWHDIMRQVVLEKKTVNFEGHTPTKLPVYISVEPLNAPVENRGFLFAPYWVVTLSDLSAIRTAEAQREEALAFLSHDIRSPLMSVLALIRNSNQHSELLDKITHYTQKGLSTSEQFLQLSRLELQGDFERYDLSLDQVVFNAIEQVFFLAQEKEISITAAGLLHKEFSDVDDDEDQLWITGNGELLERAFVNLLSNAIKYSTRSTNITVTLTASDTHLKIDIEDQGYGIPNEDLKHLFDPFFRSSKQELAQNRGAGLGLRFVKSVVERHSGRVTVHSTVGSGSLFSIALPCTPGPCTPGA